MILERQRFLKLNRKKNIDNFDFIEIKNYCSSEDTILKVEKMFPINIFDERFISRIYKELLKTCKKKEKQPKFLETKQKT